MTALAFDLHAAGVLAPGLHSLDDLRSLCRSGRPPVSEASITLSSPDVLPANERRRASQVVRLTLGCIAQALQSSAIAVDGLRSVFATDEGSGEICQQMLEALATTRQLSPLLFSNSVLNAPSGYFSIGWQNRQSATVVSVGLESFAAGLLCAVTEAVTSNDPVLLVAYDPATVDAMRELLPIAEPTATAWILRAPSADSAPTLASFVLRSSAADGQHASPLPAWMPDRWAGHSSAQSLAALGLLESKAGSEHRLALGGVMLALQRTDQARQ